MHEQTYKGALNFFISMFLFFGIALFLAYGLWLDGSVISLYVLMTLQALVLGAIAVFLVIKSHDDPITGFVYSLVFTNLLAIIFSVNVGVSVVLSTMTAVVSSANSSGIVEITGSTIPNMFLSFVLVLVFFLLPFTIYLLSKKTFPRSYFWWYIEPPILFIFLSALFTFFMNNILRF